MNRGYQPEFSNMYESMHSIGDRKRKASTMLRVLQEAFGERLHDALLLNLGCSTGIIDEFLSGHVGKVTGVDIDEPAIELARSRATADNLTFEIGDAMNLRFEDDTFDVVICSQVYEHVPDADRMMVEIRRVLRDGGVCYFAATNRWALIERHHRLPFLSWLPSRWADVYFRAAGKGLAYYERHLGYSDLRRLVRAFRVEDVTGRILAAPDRYEAGYMFRSGFAHGVARLMYRCVKRIFPGYVWLIWKDPA